uniref:Protein kinase domain-containing protein n=1 Tax=viral metagenome TaxID=1070528 RepID=A0A6C0I8F5_9ZZZZ
MRKSELRTSVVPLDVQKVSNMQGLKEQAEQHWDLKRIQAFFPSLEELFKMDSIRSPYNYGLKVRNPIQTISGPSSVYIGGIQHHIHKKVTMILPSYRIMRGDFGTSGLPCEKESSAQEYKRIHSIHNAAYVGSLANVLLSESGCVHFPEVYGAFTGIASKHVLDISDDYDDLADRPWFIQNLGHFFDLKLRSFPEDSPKPALKTDDSDILLEVEELEPIQSPEPIVLPEESSDESEDSELESNDQSMSTGYVFGIHTCSTGTNYHADGIGFEDDEDEVFAEAVFKDVPVQVTIMQRCDGTLYKLLKENTSVQKRIAWIAQIVFSLAYAQRYYGLVHNDLHVNNVMYISTTREYLYYNVGGKQYRVPTYGYIVKIIDFDRATYSVRLAGMRDPRFFMSDHFDVNEEAGGQYNLTPFYNPKFPEFKPNPSFDLVRLATSIFWDCYPKGPFEEEYLADPLFKLLMSWTTLPDGTSVLFRDLAEKDTHERYRGFHLYKAIARYCKNTAIPRIQIDLVATPYLYAERIPVGEPCLIVEA